MIRQVVLPFYVLFLYATLQSQVVPYQDARNIEREFNVRVESVSYQDDNDTPKYFTLSSPGDASLTESRAPLLIKSLFQMEDDDVLVLERMIEYVEGIRVLRFQRFFRNVRVEHGDYVMLMHDNQPNWLNGQHYHLRNADQAPHLSEETALEMTLAQLGSELYAWEATDLFLASRTDLDPRQRTALQRVREDEFPKGELVYVRDFSKEDMEACLAYKFTIESVLPLFRDHVYVSARNGNVILRDPQIKHGTGDTRYAANRVFPTTEVAPNTFELKGIDPESGVYCDTRSLEGLGGLPLSIAALYTLAVPIQDGDETSDPCILENPPAGETGDDVWNSEEHRKARFGTLCCPTYTPGASCNEFNNDDVALDAHWGASVVAQYWLKQHNRNSYDGEGADIYSFVHYGDAYDNAFWNGSYMTYGDGSYQGGTHPDGTFAPLSSMDVCAHEIGHAICETTSNLVYQRESGAMNEGFSDIWAAAIERFVLDSIDGTLPFDPFGIGEQIDESDGGLPPGDPGSRCLRWMDDPKAEGNPDTYGGINWSDPDCLEPNLANDYCGVHNNSGVLNKWYYLLTTGSGQAFSPGLNKVAADDEINDHGALYSVEGIGFKAADIIAFGGEVLLTSTATFAEMREASIHVARTLYGICSFEEIQTTNAWYAVGVGPEFEPCVPRIEFSAVNLTSVNESSGIEGCDAQTEVTLALFSFMVNQTIHFTTSGNAIEGIDYDLNPSSLTFNGSEMKSVVITVYDDKVIEDIPDTIVISFDDGGFSDQHTLVIYDDDVLPVIGGTQALLSESFDGSGIPTGWSQALVNPESANHWEFNGTGTEAGRAYAAIPGLSTAVYDQTADANVRLVSPLVDARGKRNVIISFDWEAGGETDAVDTTVLFDYGTFQISTDGLAWTDIKNYVGTAAGATRRSGTYQVTHPKLNNSRFYLGFRWYNDALVGTTFSFAIDNVLVTGDGLEIASSVGAQMEAEVPANTTIPFINSSDHRVVALVEQAQGNMGCTEIHIDANDTEEDLVALTPCGHRSAKVFEVTSSNDTDSFHLTLYFKGSEVASWANPSGLNIFGVKHTDINSTQDGMTIVENGLITVDDQLASPGNYITYTFQTTAEYLTYALTDREDHPVDRIVMNPQDSGDGSLRDRISEACPADTIRFDNTLTGDTVRLSGPEIVLDKNLVFVGPGMDLMAISGEQNARVFHVLPEVEIHLYSMELRGGNAMEQGGAILNEGILLLQDVRLHDNYENGAPAGLTNTGTVRVRKMVTINHQ